MVNRNCIAFSVELQRGENAVDGKTITTCYIAFRLLKLVNFYPPCRLKFNQRFYTDLLMKCTKEKHQNLRELCKRSQRKSQTMFTVSAAMFKISGKPRSHALDPGSLGKVLICSPFFGFCLFVLLICFLVSHVRMSVQVHFSGILH